MALKQLEYEKEIYKELLKGIKGEEDLDETLKFIQTSHKIRRKQK